MASAKKQPARAAEPAGPPMPPAPGDGNADFARQLRETVGAWAESNELRPAYREHLLALPDLFETVARLVLDARVDAGARSMLAVALAYCVSPFDILPDFIGPLGFVDDLLVLALAIESVLGRVSAEVVSAHWSGRADLASLVRDIREAADGWVGRNTYLQIRAYLTGHGIGTDLPAAGARP